MRVVITGGAGFIGFRLAHALAQRGQLAGSPLQGILLFDQVAPPPEAGPLPKGSRVAVGDIADVAQIEQLAAGPGPLTVYHLASVVSGAGERDFDLAMSVNLDGGRALLEALRRRGDAPRLIFASSIAIFSGPRMGDEVKPVPATTYGMTKAVLELLINDMSRKGFIDGRSARLPTVIVRPGKPNAAASSWASGLFREPLAGVEHHLPVPPDTKIVVGGYAGVIDNLIRLAEIPGEALGLDRAVTFPGLSVSAAEMQAALLRVGTGRMLGAVIEAPDPGITAIVRSWPGETDFARATRLGLAADPNLDSILRRYLADYGG